MGPKSSPNPWIENKFKEGLYLFVPIARLELFLKTFIILCSRENAVLSLAYSVLIQKSESRSEGQAKKNTSSTMLAWTKSMTLPILLNIFIGYYTESLEYLAGMIGLNEMSPNQLRNRW